MENSPSVGKHGAFGRQQIAGKITRATIYQHPPQENNHEKTIYRKTARKMLFVASVNLLAMPLAWFTSAFPGLFSPTFDFLVEG